MKYLTFLILISCQGLVPKNSYMVMKREIGKESPCMYIFDIVYTDNKKLDRPDELRTMDSCGRYQYNDTIR